MFYFDEDMEQVAAAKAQPLMIEGDQAGFTRLEHADLRSDAQSHFIQSRDEIRGSVDVDDATGFRSTQQSHRDGRG